MAHRRTDPAQPCNFVARDNCWKKYTESELEAARRWCQKWGFLKTPLEELIEDEKKENTKPKIQLPEHLRVRPVTPVEKYIKFDPLYLKKLCRSCGFVLTKDCPVDCPVNCPSCESTRPIQNY